MACIAFSDPGVLDHQSASLDWGDGTVEPQSAFRAFDEAFGDGNNQAAIAFLQQAVRALRDAQAGGANVTTLSALLEQVVTALSAG